MTERSRTRKLLIAAGVGAAATALLGFGGVAYAVGNEPEPTPEYVQLVDTPEDSTPRENQSESPNRGEADPECDYERAEPGAESADRA